MDKQAIGDRCGHPLRIFGTVFAVVIVTLLVHTAPFEVGQRGAAPKALGARGGTEAGAHRDRLQPGELKCGVLWFLHIPKTGGATVQAYLKERTRRYADDDDRGVKGGPRPAGKAHARWLFVDIHNGELELAWAPKAYGTGDCEPGLSEGNMSGWSQSPAWRQALRELDKPEPRLVVHQESCSPSIASLLPQLAALNGTLHANGRGCGLHLATVLREPVSQVESATQFIGRFTGGSDIVLAKAREEHAWHVNTMTSFIVDGPSWRARHDSHPGFISWMTELGQLKYRDRQFTPEEQQRAAGVLERFGLIGSTAGLTPFLARLSVLIGDPNPLVEVQHVHSRPRGELRGHARAKHAALVLEARVRTLGRGHPDLNVSGTVLASRLHAEGKHIEAEALGKEERAIRAGVDAAFEFNDADREEIRDLSTADLAIYSRFTHTGRCRQTR